MDEGKKYDEDKPRMDLLVPSFLEGVAKVLTFGAKKYEPWNWAKGIHFSRVYAAVQRHLNDWQDCRDLDPETGLNHLYHAACGLMFLSSYQAEGMREFDDRYQSPNRKAIWDSLRADIIGQNGNDGDHYETIDR